MRECLGANTRGTEMNNMKVFQYESAQIRTVDIDGDPWFVAKDVCGALDIDNASDALSRLDKDERNTIVLTEGIIGNPTKSIVNESGLYALVLSSRKPEAKAFKKWITSEVLPSIRKTGKYSIVKDMTGGFVVPRTMAEALRLAADQAEQMEKMLPKVEAAEALARCDTNMSITETAKHFGLHPKKQVFPFLRAKGFLTYRDLPTQTAIDRGIMTVRQNPVGNGDFYTQAVVEKSALDMWRTTIVPKIIEWTESTLEHIN